MTNRRVLTFLKQLSENNNRTWFEAHKLEYKELNTAFKESLFTIARYVSSFDKKVYSDPDFVKIFRIYRDVRFSVDKTPYKENFAASIVGGGKNTLNPVYYVHIQPNNQSFVGGGWVTSDSKLLYAVRHYISNHYSQLQSILETGSIKNIFTLGNHMGVLKTAPKGFAKDDPALIVIRHKSFTMGTSLTDTEVTSNDFEQKIASYFKKLHPFQMFFYKALENISKNPGEYKRS